MFTWMWAWDQATFIFVLIIGAVLVGFNMPHRKRFLLRISACLSVIICFGFAWQIFYVSLGRFYSGRWYRFIDMGKFFIQYLMVTFSMWICFDCNFFAALFCGTAGYCMEHMTQRTALIFTISFLSGKPFIFTAIVRLSIISIVYFLVYYLVVRKNKKPLSDIAVDWKIQILSSMLVMCVVVIFNSLAGRPANNTLLSRISMYILTISSAFLTLMLEFNLLFSTKRHSEIDQLRHMLYKKNEQYEIEKTNIEQINIKVHDLRHQLASLNGKIDKQELKEIYEAIDIYNSFITSGNEAIDTVITQKSLYCQKQQIRLTCLIDGKNFDFIPPHELYALFGNAIENAINAVENLDIEKRVISIVETIHGDFITVRITNYFDAEIEFDQGLPVTKKDKQYHGFGMKSIKLLAERHGGSIQTQARNDLFILSICLPVTSKYLSAI